MVEGTPLLRVQAGNRLEGSNPFGSATYPTYPTDIVVFMSYFVDYVHHFIPHIILPYSNQ